MSSMSTSAEMGGPLSGCMGDSSKVPQSNGGEALVRLLGISG